MTPRLRVVTIKVSFVDAVTELVRLKVPADVTDVEIKKIMTRANQNCFDKDIYGSAGLCAETLFNEIKTTHPSWYYEIVEPDWEWTDISVLVL